MAEPDFLIRAHLSTGRTAEGTVAASTARDWALKLSKQVESELQWTPTPALLKERTHLRAALNSVFGVGFMDNRFGHLVLSIRGGSSWSIALPEIVAIEIIDPSALPDEPEPRPIGFRPSK